jgi:glyoxylase-like metal-dependent hydrolase (beta-lactamase superfamily II)
VAVDAPEGAADWLEREGLRPELLLLTHQHFDHVLGSAELVDRFECPVWAFADRTPSLTLEEMFKGLEGTAFEIAPYPIDRLVEATAEDETIDALGCALDVLHVPGHSPDSICFLPRGQEVLFGGDVLFAGGIGRTDFPGGDTDQLLAGIRDKLFPLGDEIRVLPGHGPPTTIGEERTGNPFLV